MGGGGQGRKCQRGKARVRADTGTRGWLKPRRRRRRHRRRCRFVHRISLLAGRPYASSSERRRPAWRAAGAARSRRRRRRAPCRRSRASSFVENRCRQPPQRCRRICGRGHPRRFERPGCLCGAQTTTGPDRRCACTAGELAARQAVVEALATVYDGHFAELSTRALEKKLEQARRELKWLRGRMDKPALEQLAQRDLAHQRRRFERQEVTSQQLAAREVAVRRMIHDIGRWDLGAAWCVVVPDCNSGQQRVLAGWSRCPELKSRTTQGAERELPHGHPGAAEAAAGRRGGRHARHARAAAGAGGGPAHAGVHSAVRRGRR